MTMAEVREALAKDNALGRKYPLSTIQAMAKRTATATLASL